MGLPGDSTPVVVGVPGKITLTVVLRVRLQVHAHQVLVRLGGLPAVSMALLLGACSSDDTISLTSCEQRVSESACLADRGTAVGLVGNDADPCQWVQVARFAPGWTCGNALEFHGACVPIQKTGDAGCPGCTGRSDDVSPYTRELPDGTVEVHGRYQCGVYRPIGWGSCDGPACECFCKLAPTTPNTTPPS